MATEQAKGISKPKDDLVPDSGDQVAHMTVSDTEDGEELANLMGYRGPDGSKSLGYLMQPPVGDNAGLGSDADDAGRLKQAPGQNSGAGAPVQTQLDTAKARQADRATSVSQHE